MEDKAEKTSTKEIVESLKKLSILELNTLIKEIEEEFKINVSSFAAPSSSSSSGSQEKEETQEEVNKNIYLVSSGTNKIGVIKLVRELTSLGLMEAKKIVDSAPSLLKSDISKDEFEELKKKFSDVGAEVEFKSG